MVKVGRGASGGGGLWVALDREEEREEGLGAGRLWVVKLANEVTYKRMNWTLERLQKMQEREYTSLMRVLFGLEKPSPLPSDLENPESGAGKVEFVDQTLNESQRDAIRFALAAREVALIHGPPGVRQGCPLVDVR